MFDKYYIAGREGYPDKLLYVGSLIERKGVDLLFKAFAACDNKSLRLVLVGDGKEKDNLMNLAGQLGISDRVEFRGFLSGQALRECYKTAGASFFLQGRIASGWCLSRRCVQVCRLSYHSIQMVLLRR